MFCKECGKEIDDDSKFCKHCGKSLASVNPFYAKKRESNQLQEEAFNKLSPIKNALPEQLSDEEFKTLTDVIVLYDSAVKLNDTYPSAYLYRGIAKFLRGDTTQGLEDIRHAIFLKPFYDTAKTWLQLVEAKLNEDTELFSQIRFHIVHRSGKPFMDFSKIKSDLENDDNNPFAEVRPKFIRMTKDGDGVAKTNLPDDDLPF